MIEKENTPPHIQIKKPEENSKQNFLNISFNNSFNIYDSPNNDKNIIDNLNNNNNNNNSNSNNNIKKEKENLKLNLTNNKSFSGTIKINNQNDITTLLGSLLISENDIKKKLFPKNIKRPYNYKKKLPDLQLSRDKSINKSNCSINIKKSNEVFPSILKKITPEKNKELSNLSTNSISNNNNNSLKKKSEFYSIPKKINYISNATLTSIPKLKKEKSISLMFSVSPIKNARSLILKDKKQFSKKIKTFNNKSKENKNYTPLNELSFDEFSDISIDNNLSSQNNFNKNRNINLNVKQKKSLILPKMPSPKFIQKKIEKNNTNENRGIITIKIISIYAKKDFFNIKKIKLYDKKDNEVFCIFISINNTFFEKQENINSVFNHDKINKLDIFCKNCENINSISISNEINYGIQDIEIYKNKNFIFKGTIPNSIKEYKIIFNSNQINNYNLNNITFNNNFHNNNNINNTNNLNIFNNNIVQKDKKIKSIMSENLDLEIFNNILSPKKSPSNKSNISYVKCKKLKFSLISNYGHKDQIGLTGLEIYIINKKGRNLINFNDISSIGAMPKDLSTFFNINDKRIFENLFNKQNKTIDDNLMWLTININVYIEIIFKKQIYLNSIKFWNFNKPNEINKGVKEINLFIDDNKNPLIIILHKGIEDDIIDFSQEITFPYKNNNIFTNEEIEPFKQFKFASLLYYQNYETPYLPIGSVLKFILLDNWGDKNFIAIDDIKIYDQLGRNVKCQKSKNEYYDIFKDFKKYDDNKRNNILYVFLEKIVGISYIRIFNHKKDVLKGVRKLIIKLDENIIFNGNVNKYNNINNGCTVILFTCDLQITKNIKESELSGYNENILSNRKEKVIKKENELILKVKI